MGFSVFFFNLNQSILSVSWILFKMSSFNLIEIGTLIQLRTMAYLPSSFVQEFNYFFCFDRRVLPIQCIVLDILEFLLTNHFSRLIDKKYFTIKQNILRINKNKTMKKNRAIQFIVTKQMRIDYINSKVFHGFLYCF